MIFDIILASLAIYIIGALITIAYITSFENEDHLKDTNVIVYLWPIIGILIIITAIVEIVMDTFFRKH